MFTGAYYNNWSRSHSRNKEFRFHNTAFRSYEPGLRVRFGHMNLVWEYCLCCVTGCTCNRWPRAPWRATWSTPATPSSIKEKTQISYHINPSDRYSANSLQYLFNLLMWTYENSVTCCSCAVPPHVDPQHAAFIEPLACSLHAVELGNIQVIQPSPLPGQSWNTVASSLPE
jgi:hypothetical protein